MLLRLKAHDESLVDRCLEKLDLTCWMGCMGGDPWAPCVMPNGSVLVRNHHRVVGTTYSDTLRIKNMSALAKDLERIADAADALEGTDN